MLIGKINSNFGNCKPINAAKFNKTSKPRVCQVNYLLPVAWILEMLLMSQARYCLPVLVRNVHSFVKGFLAMTIGTERLQVFQAIIILYTIDMVNMKKAWVSSQ